MATTAKVFRNGAGLGNKRISVYDVTMDSSYPTGGESITASDLGLRRVDFAICTVKAVSGTVNVAQAHYIPSTGKLKVYDETPGEVANAADLSNVVIQVVAIGN